VCVCVCLREREILHSLSLSGDGPVRTERTQTAAGDRETFVDALTTSIKNLYHVEDVSFILVSRPEVMMFVPPYQIG